MNKEKKNIFLIGFMGAGKSTIARAIKQKLGYPVVEMDERIVKEQGMPISKIFETYGELYFRELETKLIQSLCHNKFIAKLFPEFRRYDQSAFCINRMIVFAHKHGRLTSPSSFSELLFVHHFTPQSGFFIPLSTTMYP